MKTKIRILLFSAVLLSIFSCDNNKIKGHQATQEKPQNQQQVPESAASETERASNDVDNKWAEAKEETEKALQQSKEAGQAIWEASKESSSEIWSDSRETSEEILGDVKEKSTEIWDDIKEKSNDMLEKLFDNGSPKEGTKPVSNGPIQI